VVIDRMANYISQGSRRGGKFYCSFVANLLQYLCAKNYQNSMRFDKAIAKIEGCNFFASQCTCIYNACCASSVMILNQRRWQTLGGQHGKYVDGLFEKVSFQTAFEGVESG